MTYCESQATLTSCKQTSFVPEESTEPKYCYYHIKMRWGFIDRPEHYAYE